jgi:hypothetical protein
LRREERRRAQGERHKAESGRQMTEDRLQSRISNCGLWISNLEERSQETEVGGARQEARGQRSEVGSQRTDDGGQKTISNFGLRISNLEARSQETEVGRQKRIANRQS